MNGLDTKQPFTDERWRWGWERLTILEKEAAENLCLKVALKMSEIYEVTKYSETEAHVILKTTNSAGEVTIVEKVLPWGPTMSYNWFSALSDGVWYTKGFKNSYNGDYKWLLFYNLDKIFSNLPQYKGVFKNV